MLTLIKHAIKLVLFSVMLVKAVLLGQEPLFMSQSTISSLKALSRELKPLKSAIQWMSLQCKVPLYQSNNSIESCITSNRVKNKEPKLLVVEKELDKKDISSNQQFLSTFKII